MKILIKKFKKAFKDMVSTLKVKKNDENYSIFENKKVDEAEIKRFIIFYKTLANQEIHKKLNIY